jgi:C1q domain
MAIRPDYDIGTVTLTSGSSDFTTSGSALQTAAVQAGDSIITPSGHILIIASITGQNSGTLFLPCPPSAAGTGLALRIRFQPDGSRYQGAVRNLIDTLSSGNIEAFAALVGSNGLVPIFTGVGTMDLADPATFGIPDPNGSLGKLAALTLAANKILNTDASGELTQSDITAAALALLKLSGTPAANMLPYLTGAGAADLTTLTPFMRTILDDADVATLRASISVNRPAFHTRLASSVNIANGDTLISFTSTQFNIGNHWSGTTFTAPVAGVYWFGLWVQIVDGTTNVGQGGCAIRLNGATYNSSFQAKTGYYMPNSVSCAMNLAAGNTVQFYTSLDSMSGNPALQGGRTWASGFLLG